MMKLPSVNYFAFLIMLMISIQGCGRKPTFADQADQTFSKCLGEEEYQLLSSLNQQFEKFLLDNGFCHNESDKLAGYKKYLQYLLDNQGMDSSWVFQKAALEQMLLEFEKHHFAEVLYADKVSLCVLKIAYPDEFLMAGYREIMPQHSVSPEKFAREFISKMDEDQFRDPVVKMMVSLEYFLGPVLFKLRPDKQYLAEAP